MTAIALALYLLTPQSDWNERQWSAHIAQQLGGKTEVRTPDGSRADIVTATEAYEVEWARNHWQAPAQAVFYGVALNRKPVVILLMRPGDKRFFLRCAVVCAKWGVRLEARKIP